MGVVDDGELQLGSVDVAADRLQVSGDRLEDLLTQLTVASPMTETDESLPVAGWRVISYDGSAGVTWIAAPFEEGWRLVSIAIEDGVQYVNPYPGVLRPIPGRRQRSQPIELRVSSNHLRWHSGSSPEFLAEIHNHAAIPFPTAEEDNTLVVGWLRSSDGSRLPSEEGFAFSPLNHRDPAEPGGMLRVPVRLLTLSAGALAPGKYELEILLTTLQITTTREVECVT